MFLSECFHIFFTDYRDYTRRPAPNGFRIGGYDIALVRTRRAVPLGARIQWAYLNNRVLRVNTRVQVQQLAQHFLRYKFETSYERVFWRGKRCSLNFFFK